MADDEDAIYVDVIPRLDEAAADEAEEKLRDKFKDAAKDIGDSVKGAFENLGDHVKDVFSKDNIRGAVKDARDTIGDALGSDLGKEIVGDLRKTIEEELGYTVNDALGGIGRQLGTNLRDLIGGDFIDAATNKVQTVTDALNKLHSGQTIDGLKTLSQAVRGIVPDEFLDHADGVLDVFTRTNDSIQSFIKDTVDSGKNLQEALGFAGTGGLLSAASELAGPLGLIIGGSTALLGPGGISDRIGTSLFNSAAPNSFLFHDQGIPVPESALGPPPTPAAIQALPQPKLGQFFRPSGQQTMTAGSDLPSFAQYDQPDNPKNPGNQPAYVAPPVAPASAGSANVQAQQATVEAGAATISAGSLSLGGLSLPGLGSRPTSTTAPAFGKSSWFSSGGILPGDSPGYDNMFGMLPGGRPIGLEGGEFVVNPQATQDNLDLLRAINSGSMPHFDGGDLLPGGDKGANQSPKSANPFSSVMGNMPKPGSDVHTSMGPPPAPGEPSPPQTIIPQGQGKGLSISGGILGGAEGAAAGAADLFAPGSGAAVQIATQEANKAIETGVKAGITAGIEAPLDTFWLSDSGLSDPSHSWFGKLGLSLIGQTGGLAQNLAGKTQAPLTPGQGQQGGGQPQGQHAPSIHIENQYNASDVDHANNNQTLMGQVAANSMVSNSAYGY